MGVEETLEETEARPEFTRWGMRKRWFVGVADDEATP
jgi:hypothetical protein